MSAHNRVIPEELSVPKDEPDVRILPATVKKTSKRKMNALNVFLTILIVAACVLTIPCCIVKYEKNCNAGIMQQTLETEKNRGARLRIEYEIRTDYKVIENYVTDTLMMKKQENYQIEYVLRDTDNLSVVVNPESQNENILTALSRTFSAITEYFR